MGEKRRGLALQAHTSASRVDKKGRVSRPAWGLESGSLAAAGSRVHSSAPGLGSVDVVFTLPSLQDLSFREKEDLPFCSMQLQMDRRIWEATVCERIRQQSSQ